jgi:hypothetical protein
MQALTWLDLHLDAPSPFVLVRASTAKNHTQAALPLVPNLVSALKAHRAQQRVAIGKVFRRGVPTAKTLRKDLAACGIPHTDELGRRVDNSRFANDVLHHTASLWRHHAFCDGPDEAQ